MDTAALLNQAAEGDVLTLRREYDNPADANAIAVHLSNGTKLAYIAREVARILAPLLDLENGPHVTATLAQLPADHATWVERDTILAQLHLAPITSGDS